MLGNVNAQSPPDDRPQPGPGQESVWDYPREPRMVDEPRQVRVYIGGIPIVNTTKAVRVLEQGLAPAIYVPSQDFRHCELRRLKQHDECEHKGTATYYTIVAAGKIAHRAAWAYAYPRMAYRHLTGYLGIYPERVERALLGDEEVQAQPGGYWGGWVTSEILGPFRDPPERTDGTG